MLRSGLLRSGLLRTGKLSSAKIFASSFEDIFFIVLSMKNYLYLGHSHAAVDFAKWEIFIRKSQDLKSIRAELDSAKPPRYDDQHVFDVQDIKEVQHTAAWNEVKR
jgi:hypothetical protein